MSFRECRFCGVGGKYKGRYTVEQVLISGHSQYRDATAVCQLVRPAICAVLPHIPKSLARELVHYLHHQYIHVHHNSRLSTSRGKQVCSFVFNFSSDKVQRAFCESFPSHLIKKQNDSRGNAVYVSRVNKLASVKAT